MCWQTFSRYINTHTHTHTHAHTHTLMITYIYSNCCISSHANSIIVDKIDTNKDGQVTAEELEQWVRQISKRYIYDDVDRVWVYHDKDKDSFISWEDYLEASYGVVEGTIIQYTVVYNHPHMTHIGY